MNKLKELWGLRVVIGIFLSFGLFVYLSIWCLMHYPLYVVAGIALLIVVVKAVVKVTQPAIRREKARTDGLVAAAFQEAYGHLAPPPALKASSSYGYPAFEVIFNSKAELESAASGNEAFKAAIGRIYQRIGSGSLAFNADKAIYFTYSEPLAEPVASQGAQG
ncbi:MAG: hypothetical protein JSS11_14005 [Verrucomicrobia bacterium]|nr:hypothetical protein [Verrucomicrobiota bacterium]